MAGESSKQIIENTTQVPSLPLEFFEGITKNFSERRQIGQGGSGIVYKVRFNHTFSAIGIYLGIIIFVNDRV